MTHDQKKTLEQLTGEGIRFHYPMHRLTTYKVGGPLKPFGRPETLIRLKRL